MYLKFLTSIFKNSKFILFSKFEIFVFKILMEIKVHTQLVQNHNRILPKREAGAKVRMAGGGGGGEGRAGR